MLNFDSGSMIRAAYIKYRFLIGTHALFNLVSDCLDDSGAVALTQLLSGPQVVAGRLHLLLLERHHGILQRNAAKTVRYRHIYYSDIKLSCFTEQIYAQIGA